MYCCKYLTGAGTIFIIYTFLFYLLEYLTGTTAWNIAWMLCIQVCSHGWFAACILWWLDFKDLTRWLSVFCLKCRRTRISFRYFIFLHLSLRWMRPTECCSMFSHGFCRYFSCTLMLAACHHRHAMEIVSIMQWGI